MHQYITIMKEHEFVLWVIGAKAEQKGKFVYDLPDNVTEIHEVFLDDALKIRENGVRYVRFSPEEECALGEVMDCKSLTGRFCSVCTRRERSIPCPT